MQRDVVEGSSNALLSHVAYQRVASFCCIENEVKEVPVVLHVGGDLRQSHEAPLLKRGESLEVPLPDPDAFLVHGLSLLELSEQEGGDKLTG